MKKMDVLLIVCQKCRRVKQFGGWVILTPKQETELELFYLINKTHIACPDCQNKEGGK